MVHEPQSEDRDGVSAASAPCRRVGRLIEKGGCFALHEDEGDGGGDVWLELDPVPLHLLDEEVEITGERFGTELIWVRSIGPVRSFS